MEWVIFWLIMGGVVALIANSKGKNALHWFLYGAAIWPIALTHIIVTKPDPAPLLPTGTAELAAANAAPLSGVPDGFPIEEGRLGDRRYQRYADGSVEIPTASGPRRFASLQEAENYVTPGR